jgi:hypothetical protein
MALVLSTGFAYTVHITQPETCNMLPLGASCRPATWVCSINLILLHNHLSCSSCFALKYVCQYGMGCICGEAILHLAAAKTTWLSEHD